MSAEEYVRFNSFYADITVKRDFNPNREYTVQTGINNKAQNVFVQVKGELRCPKILSVTRFNIENADELERWREFANEYGFDICCNYAGSHFGKEIVKRYSKSDIKNFREFSEQRRNLQQDDRNNKNQQGRSGNSKQNSANGADLNESAFSMPEKNSILLPMTPFPLPTGTRTAR